MRADAASLNPVWAPVCAHINWIHMKSCMTPVQLIDHIYHWKHSMRGSPQLLSACTLFWKETSCC